MISKLIFAPKARPDLTRAQAQKHLREIHGPLAAGSPSFRTWMKSYIQNYVLDAPVVPKLGDRDWVIEQWRDDSVVLPDPPVEPEAIALRADAVKFPDLTSILAVLTQEDLVWAADKHERFAAAPVKVFSYLKRRPGASDEDFAKEWRAAGEALAASPAFQKYARRYTQNRCVLPPSAPGADKSTPGAGRILPYDGVDVARFKDAAAVEAMFADADFLAALAAYEEACTDPAKTFRQVTSEEIVFDDAGVQAAATA